ncbi:GDP-L-fucose synthase [Azovibrio restrictus]|uniref:GDP-L-fucose synthase family protein n=1 Tax=Azovibrio restrictus TaxID=146938 RepID=UPI0026E92495|nr:GDP-L-fucose synthase [Azovibrio restrictus]
MRIFLTGGRGMVGRNFMEHPAASDYEIFAPTSSELDLRDYKEVCNFIWHTSPDIVVHAAGRVGGIQANMREPVSFLIENLDMGRNVILSARQAGIKKLLNLGSSCMYPRNAPNPLREEKILAGELEPTNEGYALAKIVTAKLCDYINRKDNCFQYKTLIPCNIYGRHDKFNPENSHMVPAAIHKIHQAKINGVNEVLVWGTGNARREFMYAGDLADCMWRAIENFETLPSVMNVGLGFDFSILDYYKTIAKVVGYTGTFVHDLTKPEGMVQKLVSTEKLEKWGWAASTTLEQGVTKTYQFYLERIRA